MQCFDAAENILRYNFMFIFGPSSLDFLQSNFVLTSRRYFFSLRNLVCFNKIGGTYVIILVHSIFSETIQRLSQYTCFFIKVSIYIFEIRNHILLKINRRINLFAIQLLIYLQILTKSCFDFVDSRLILQNYFSIFEIGVGNFGKGSKRFLVHYERYPGMQLVRHFRYAQFRSD